MILEKFSPEDIFSEEFIARQMQKLNQEHDYTYDTEFKNGNITIAEGCCYSLDDIDTRLNNNVIGVGGSGTGKTRGIVTPAIYEAVGSYVISDPKGNLHAQYGNYLRNHGYDVRKIDFNHPELSDRYNPLHRRMTTQEIVKTASQIVYSDSETRTLQDPFWDQNAMILLSAIIAYMVESHYEIINFKGILRLLRESARTSEDTKRSVLSDKIRRHKAEHESSWACDQFESVNSAPDKTFDCIRATLASKFANFDSQELHQMMSGNDFDLADIGRKKMAVFVIVSDTDRSMDTLVNMFFTQTMNNLVAFADEECSENRLPVPVRFILDDFATNCKIKEFPRMISSIRSRAISVILLIQAEAQLYKGYGADSSTIISNCDTYVYLGGNDTETAKHIALRCDKPLGKILYMPVGECIVFRRGSAPVYARIYDSSNEIQEMKSYSCTTQHRTYA